MPRGKNKHMDINDRIRIQQGLDAGESLSAIARAVGVSASTVSREVRQNRTRWVPKSRADFNRCALKRECNLTGICGGCTLAHCKDCARVRCNDVCIGFDELECDVIARAPFVCGECSRRHNCGFTRADYVAVEAQQAYEMRLVATREGISLTPEQLESVVSLVRRRLRQGWSLDAIWAVHGAQMPITSRTMYSYIERGVLGLANIDLPRKVRYRPRKAISGFRPVDRDGRSYGDFLDLPREIRERAVQMDTVIGRARDFKCILTLHFPSWELQLMVLLDEHTCECVVGALDWIECVVGTAEFARLFGVVLTDRGVEFGDFEAIERSALGNGRRCRVFYCDPMRSGQKGSCEKNHVELRRVLPKGTSFEGLTAYDVATVCTHVNNYPRKGLGGATPYSLAARHLPKNLLDELGVARLSPGEAVLTPALLERDGK